MIQTNKNLDELTFQELLQEYGLADFTYLEMASYLEELESYRQKLHEKIKEFQNEASKSLGSSPRNEID